MKICYFCKSTLKTDRKPGRAEACPFCKADLHCCFNCTFYDEGAYNNCREPRAERVLEKDKSNFCDYFSFRDSSTSTDYKTQKNSIQNQLDGLFKKK